MSFISEKSLKAIDSILSLNDITFLLCLQDKKNQKYWDVSISDMLVLRSHLQEIFSTLAFSELREIFSVYIRGMRIWEKKNTFSFSEVESVRHHLEDSPWESKELSSKDRLIEVFLSSLPMFPKYLSIGFSDAYFASGHEFHA